MAEIRSFGRSPTSAGFILGRKLDSVPFSAYHLACVAPAPFRRAATGIAVVSGLVVATAAARPGFQPLDLVAYAAVTLALGLFVAMMQAIHEQSEQRARLLEQLDSARGELAAAERRAGVLAERQRQ